MKREELGIPPFLYRGDVSFRYVVDNWDKYKEWYKKHKKNKPSNHDMMVQNRLYFIQYELFSKLLLGGNPYEVYKPIYDLIKKHVCEDWQTTHFISMSTEEDVAKRYALGYPSEKIEKAKFDFDNMLNSYDDNWDFCVASIDLGSFEFEKLESGIYKDNKGVMLLIHIVDLDIDKSSKTFSNGKRDEEWLILPLEKLQDGTLTAILKSVGLINFDFRCE